MTPTPKKGNAGPKSLKLKEIAALVRGEVVGNDNLTITGVAGIQEACKGDITFLANPRYLPFLKQTKASAVVTSKEMRTPDISLIRTDNPSQAFTAIISLFMPDFMERRPAGIHPSALIAKSARVDKQVSIGPYVVIEEGAVVGEGSVIEASVFIGRNTRVGRDCLVYPHVTIREGTRVGDRVIIHSGTVVGSDGFGYDMQEEKPVKIPQIGSVTIEDDVEIGANVCIDRGRFKETLIGKGTKIDNLVQIAHNVVIGPHCLIVAQAGIAGSAQLGQNVVIAGQVGVIGHITIGDHAVIGGGSGVTKSVPPKAVMLGVPARPIVEQRKIFAIMGKLPELFKDVADLKKKKS